MEILTRPLAFSLCPRPIGQNIDGGLQVLRRQVSIAHSHFNIPVPQEFGYRPQIDALHHQTGGEGVAQIVKADISRHIGPL